MSSSTVTIAVLLPDVLGTYSDAGNAIVLAQRLRWRGIPARVLSCPAHQEPPTSCEIYLLGGGEDAAQLFAARWVRERPALCQALAERGITLAICAGMQILGHNMATPDGKRHPGAGLLDITTQPGAKRAIGQVVAQCALPGVGTLCGFENHRGRTTLGAAATPLGTVISGIGNDGPTPPGPAAAEGACSERILGTYLHGPALARNPALADYILARTIGRPLIELDLPDQAAMRAQYLPTRNARRRP